MLPVEVLITEHRLIMYTVGVLKKEQQKIAAQARLTQTSLLQPWISSAPSLTGTIMAKKRASCSTRFIRGNYPKPTQR